MPTAKPRFMVTISDEMRNEIDNYRFEHRCKSQTQAINELIERGLDVVLGDTSKIKEEPANTDGLTEEEISFLQGFSTLTASNRRLLTGILALLIREQGQSDVLPG